MTLLKGCLHWRLWSRNHKLSAVGGKCLLNMYIQLPTAYSEAHGLIRTGHMTGFGAHLWNRAGSRKSLLPEIGFSAPWRRPTVGHALSPALRTSGPQAGAFRSSSVARPSQAAPKVNILQNDAGGTGQHGPGMVQHRVNMAQHGAQLGTNIGSPRLYTF